MTSSPNAASCIKYDAAYVPMREPDINTWQFEPHIYECLELAMQLQQGGVVDRIVITGGRAKRYEVEEVTPPFEAESDVGEQYLVKELKYTGPISKERGSQTSITNHIYTTEQVFARGGIKSVLLISAMERALRLHHLGSKVLPKREIPVFHFTTAGRAPHLLRGEAFALAMQTQYLRNIPDGRAGWGTLAESDFEGPELLPFWREFDRVRAALRQAMPPGTTPEISDIVTRMNESGLLPGMKEFAIAAAGNLALPSIVEHDAFRPAHALLPSTQPQT